MEPLPFFFPADSLTPGANLAQETRCPAVGKRVMSSADLGQDRVRGGRADAGDLIQPLATAAANGAICSSILASSAAMSALIASTRASILPSRNAWWSVK